MRVRYAEIIIERINHGKVEHLTHGLREDTGKERDLEMCTYSIVEL